MAAYCTVVGKTVSKQRDRVFIGLGLWMPSLSGFIVAHTCHLRPKHIGWMEFCSAYGYHGQVSPVQDRPLQLDMEKYFIQGSLWDGGGGDVAQWWLSACLACDSISSRGPLLGAQQFCDFPRDVTGKTPWSRYHPFSLSFLQFIRCADTVRSTQICIWFEWLAMILQLT